MCGVTRGTTPILVFKLPISTDELDEVWVTLGQKGKFIVNKTSVDATMDGNILSVHLSQQDTLLLDSKLNTEIQVRARTKDGDALASKIITVSTDRILKDGVI